MGGVLHDVVLGFVFRPKVVIYCVDSVFRLGTGYR